MSKEQVNEVIEEVIGLLVKANNSTSICRHLMKKYDIKERQAKNYLAAARKEIVKRFTPDVQAERMISAVRFQDLYQKNYTRGDYKECRAVQESFNKLFGVNEPEKTDNKHTINIEITEKDVDLFKNGFNSKYK